ncbi:MAG: hypothetical protein ACKOJF_13295, partial [Planctomycetaceae bacterium]
VNNCRRCRPEVPSQREPAINESMLRTTMRKELPGGPPGGACRPRWGMVSPDTGQTLFSGGKGEKLVRPLSPAPKIDQNRLRRQA